MRQAQDKDWCWKGDFYWALVRGPKALPVIFKTLEQARENRDPDERIVRVFVTGLGGRTLR